MDNKIIELANLIKDSSNVVVFTGAGMDTESNVPDFRGENGWWKNLDPRIIASIDTFYENYSLFHEFYSMRTKLLESRDPHKGHYILGDLEAQGFINTIATQNVSQFHFLAGSKKVYELHGNIRTFRCNDCNKSTQPVEFLENKKCGNCGKKALRPNVTLFGESLPSNDWDRALEAVIQSDILIVIGTSLEVSPANQIPNLSKGKTIYINDDIEGVNFPFDIVIKGKAKEVLEELYVYIKVKDS